MGLDPLPIAIAEGGTTPTLPCQVVAYVFFCVPAPVHDSSRADHGVRCPHLQQKNKKESKLS